MTSEQPEANIRAAAPINAIDQYLQFELTSTLSAMLPTVQISEILSLAVGQIVPIFDMPGSVMGVCNRRGEVLWVVDLADLLGLPSLYAQSEQRHWNVMVLHQQQQRAGMAVLQLGQLLTCRTAQIQPPSTGWPAQLQACLQGVHHLADRTDILVLDGEKILGLLKTSSIA